MLREALLDDSRSRLGPDEVMNPVTDQGGSITSLSRTCRAWRHWAGPSTTPTFLAAPTGPSSQPSPQDPAQIRRAQTRFPRIAEASSTHLPLTEKGAILHCGDGPRAYL